MKTPACLATALLLFTTTAFSCTEPVSLCHKPSKTSFPLIGDSQPAALLIEPTANSAVAIASRNFASDLARVSVHEPIQVTNPAAAQGVLVIAGVVGQSAAVDGL